MTKHKKNLLTVLALLILTMGVTPAFAESQSNDYKGITDPFGDPANYEFAEDEKEDKEFFHLGRFLMLGFDLGAGVFTGGLGATNAPAFIFGGKLIYFFDRSLALDIGLHMARHDDTIRPTTGGEAILSHTLMPINLGFRYHFDTKEAPKAIAISNPFIAFGSGLYFRTMEVTSSNVAGFAVTTDTTSNIGIYLGGGIEFEVYRKHLYVGLDTRFHLVFFSDENDTLGGRVPAGERSGDYFSIVASANYSF